MSNLVTHKKARFNYEILESFEAGIELLGFEVKALREHKGSLDGAYVTLRGSEAFLINFDLPAYQEKNTPESYDSNRNRKLLLTKAEIAKLSAQESKKGLTIIPVSVYNKGRKVKVSIALVRGKKEFDKRETIKKRDTERHIQRTLKNE